MLSSHMLREGARPEFVRGNMGHFGYRRDPELPATERRNLTPHSSYSHDRNLNHNLVHLFLDEVH
jgi:hypothetical protein